MERRQHLGGIMTEVQSQWYLFILPVTTIPTTLLLAYLRFKVVPTWFKFLEENNDSN